MDYFTLILGWGQGIGCEIAIGRCVEVDILGRVHRKLKFFLKLMLYDERFVYVRYHLSAVIIMHLENMFLQ